MTDYRIELQAFVDAAASFTEPALGHHKAWAEAVARARVALSMPESSASTVCPITPPPELVDEWLNSTRSDDCIGAYPTDFEQRICTAAARWGADQELEACITWVAVESLEAAKELRAGRRPKPPSLKERALEELDGIAIVFRMTHGGDLVCDTIRRALEQLDD